MAAPTSWAAKIKSSGGGGGGGRQGWSLTPASGATPAPSAPASAQAPSIGTDTTADARSACAAAEEIGQRYSQMTLEQLYEQQLTVNGVRPPAEFGRQRAGQTFELTETVKGKKLNSLSGLALHREVLSEAEQLLTVRYLRRLRELGDDGALAGRTYSAPRRWMRGKGRVTIQMGCCYNYARDKSGNPPGILPREPVCGMPHFFEQIIDRMISRGIFNAQTRPDTCIVNFYSEGDCIPPHIDHHDFTRPFVTLSLLTEQKILFGANIAIVDEGQFSAPFEQQLPVGSVLVLDGNGANVAKHCVPSVVADRISITFRKIGAKIKMEPFGGPTGATGGATTAAAGGARSRARGA